MICQGGVKKNIDPHLRKGKYGWEKNLLRLSVQNQRTKPRSDAAAGDWTQGQREHWAKRPVPGALSTQLFSQVIKAFKAQAVCAKTHQRDGNRGSNYLGFFMITPGVTMLIIESNSKHEVLFRLPFLIWSNHFSHVMLPLGTQLRCCEEARATYRDPHEEESPPLRPFCTPADRSHWLARVCTVGMDPPALR